MSYLGTKPSNSTPTYKIKSEFVATAGQTVFAPSAYSAGYIDVYRNGVKLGNADFTATNGTTVTLAQGATAGDLITFESVFLASIQNGIPATTGAVSTSLIADNAVTTDKIAPGAVVQSDLASNVAGTGPAFSAYQGVAQTVSSNTITIIQMDTKEFDTSSCFNNTGSTVGGIPAYAFKPTVAGYYQINGATQAGIAFTGGYAAIYKNGSMYKSGVSNNTGTTNNVWTVNSLVYMNGTTDYVQLASLLASGQALYNSSTGTYFNGFLARAA